MKKIILSLAAATLIFASCTKETTISEITGNPDVVGFDLSTGKTRATVNTLKGMQNDVKGFGVFATKGSSSIFIDNLSYVYDKNVQNPNWKWESDGDDDTNNDVEWPEAAADYPINFYAYYPNNETVTPKFSLDDEVVGQKTYSIDTLISKQYDLMAASKLGVVAKPLSSNVSLHFKHILSQVKFTVLASSTVTVEVQSIAIKNIGETATFNYGTLEWVSPPPALTQTYKYAGPEQLTAGSNKIVGTDVAQSVTSADGGVLMLMPQNLSQHGWDPADTESAELDLKSLSYIEVVYRMYESATNTNNVVGFGKAGNYPDGEDGEGDDKYDYDDNDSDKPLFVKVAYKLDTNWEMNKSYTYEIELGTPDSSGGNLANNFFIDETGEPTDLPVVDPNSGNPIVIPEPLINLAANIGFKVQVGGWTETKYDENKDAIELQ
jgi:hypothetical protein